MILRKNVLDYLERAIVELRGAELGPAPVLRANAPRELGDAALYFTVAARDFRTRRETERTRITTCVGEIGIVGLPGEGAERLDAIAGALVDLLTPPDGARLGRADALERVYPEGTRRLAIYPLDARRAPDEFKDGRYKSTVLLTLEIWED